MAHIPLTTQEAARGALAAIGGRFMPLASVIDMATALLEADRDDPAVREHEEAREFEVRLAHERDEEALLQARRDDPEEDAALRQDVGDLLDDIGREWTETGGWTL